MAKKGLKELVLAASLIVPFSMYNPPIAYPRASQEKPKKMIELVWRFEFNVQPYIDAWNKIKGYNEYNLIKNERSSLDLRFINPSTRRYFNWEFRFD